MWYLVDRAVLGVARRQAVGDSSHVLIAPPGGGNIGDQALVDAYLENTTALTRVIVRSASDVDVSRWGNASVYASPGLVYGGLFAHLVAVVRLRKIFAQAAVVSVVGADIMDGAYNPRASFARSSIVAAARATGIPSRVLGFSWNSSPHPKALRSLRRAGRRGVVLFLRDPISLRRAVEDKIPGVRPAADIVFSAVSVSTHLPVELSGWDAARGPIAVVNASGLIAESGTLEEFRTIVDALLQRGYRVLVLPHVSRPGADDMLPCRELATFYKKQTRVAFVPRLLRPDEVRAVAAEAAVVVTGRMHLGVMALSQSVPAIILATQGKVEGLMALFNLPDFCVEPRTGFGGRVVQQIEQVGARRALLHRGIEDSLVTVKRLSQANFEMGVVNDESQA